ncbi:hypothetical protein SAMN05216309_11238 [Nitrosomonas europaea]|nr:hypothetical protein SAMN05216310_1327 [Nitrosomonas europaea]SES98305.1 hypothetical protein SAMN05216309_11238 [Nitrosomonas europaea]SJZ48726.1 hypothetical protein SAMN02745113_01065 [Nitrosomonas europaea]
MPLSFLLQTGAAFPNFPCHREACYCEEAKPAATRYDARRSSNGNDNKSIGLLHAVGVRKDGKNLLIRMPFEFW